MFRRYQESTVWYAFLSDIPPTDLLGKGSDSPGRQQFAESKWFTGGWSLQEHLAPDVLHFFSNEWTSLGTRAELWKLISEASGIEVDFLTATALQEAGVARRMSWASTRTTTSREDITYCLLGIFNVNMPMLYGEGEKAFQRLQDEDHQELGRPNNPRVGPRQGRVES
jgi:hypothetical protein